MNVLHELDIEQDWKFEPSDNMFEELRVARANAKSDMRTGIELGAHPHEHHISTALVQRKTGQFRGAHISSNSIA